MLLLLLQVLFLLMLLVLLLLVLLLLVLLLLVLLLQVLLVLCVVIIVVVCWPHTLFRLALHCTKLFLNYTQSADVADWAGEAFV